MKRFKTTPGVVRPLCHAMRWCAVLSALAWAIGGRGYAQGGQSEYAVKAAFLYNFAKFVEWPNNAFSNSNAPLVIGICGSDPFGGTIEDVMSGKTIDGRRIIIKRFGGGAIEDRVHILFVPESAMSRAGAISELRSKSTLIVGETDDFARKYGQIDLILERNRMVFDVNATAAKSSGLTISSKLLQLARKVF